MVRRNWKRNSKGDARVERTAHSSILINRLPCERAPELRFGAELNQSN